MIHVHRLIPGFFGGAQAARNVSSMKETCWILILSILSPTTSLALFPQTPIASMFLSLDNASGSVSPGAFVRRPPLAGSLATRGSLARWPATHGERSTAPTPFAGATTGGTRTIQDPKIGS